MQLHLCSHPKAEPRRSIVFSLILACSYSGRAELKKVLVTPVRARRWAYNDLTAVSKHLR